MIYKFGVTYFIIDSGRWILFLLLNLLNIQQKSDYCSWDIVEDLRYVDEISHGFIYLFIMISCEYLNLYSLIRSVLLLVASIKSLYLKGNVFNRIFSIEYFQII